MGVLLDRVNCPSDLKKLTLNELAPLADEVRLKIIDVVSERGGHLASSLGCVELIIALHYIFNTPRDKIIFDVGHQAYAHKILTERKDKMSSIRKLGGISGFPNKDESPYDVFTVGHASTSISTALGLASARDLTGSDEKIIAVIGDASLSGGMAFEALNHAGHLQKDLIVILNDNEMSISKSVGALTRYLNKIISAPAYNKLRKDVENLVKKIPRFGFRVYRMARRLEESIKSILIPGMLFEELGFRYFGPIDGNNINLLVQNLKNIKDLKEPVLLHIVTKKGKGYEQAENHPEKFHGTGPFYIYSGDKRSASAQICCTGAFSEKLVELGRNNQNIIAVSAAMADGTGLDKFALEFPKRFFDVGIAEAHAVGFSAGLAKKGLIPVCAVYSTFLQRSYDQMIHDVALQDLHVVFCLDRAGLVGEDGPTHHGVFDIAYMRTIPNMVLMAPSTIDELKSMLEFAVNYNGPISMRYPRGGLPEIRGNIAPIELGKAEILKEGKDICILAIGSMVSRAFETAGILSKDKISAAVVNARFAKPLDEALLKILAKKYTRFATIEEGVIGGGFGSAVCEFFHREDLDNKIKIFGLEDKFIQHGQRDELLDLAGLSKEKIALEIIKWLR